MPNAPRSILAAFTVLAGLLATVSACSDDPPPRLPDHVTVAIVYNGEAERWHAGTIVTGDQAGSSLRVLCLTEAGKPWADGGHTHTGINIDVQLGESERPPGLDWHWQIDGREWNGGPWSLSFSTQPPTLLTKDPEIEAALLHQLRNAATAKLVGTNDGEERFSMRFDLTTLFITPVQFAIDDCNADAIEQQVGGYHLAYAYWIPDSKRHSLILSEGDPASGRTLLVTCGPTGWTDDDAPDWIREANGEVYAMASLTGFRDESTHASQQHDAPTDESATVSWIDSDGNASTATWDAYYDSMQPSSTSENLAFIDALRGSEELTVTVELTDAEPVEFTLRGAALFAKPMGPELDTCIREYAALNS